MKWVRKTICIFLGLAMLTSSAFAEIPNYTVIIGNNAFALKYANDEENIDEIRDVLKKNKGEVIIKTKNKWYKNNGEIFQELSSLPRVIYIDEDGNKCEYKEGNGDKIIGEILSIDVVDGNIIRIKFTQKLDMQWINNRENFLVNGVELTEEDVITYNEEEGYVEIKLHKNVNNSVELLMKNITNQHGEILYDEFKEKIVLKSETNTNSGGYASSYRRINIKTIEFLDYDTLKINTENEFDKNGNLMDMIGISINGKACEVLEASNSKNSITISLRNSYVTENEMISFKYSFKKADNIKVSYNGKGEDRLKENGKKIKNFSKTIEMSQELENINGKNISMRDLTFNGEINNEDNEIILFNIMTNEMIKDKVSIPEGTELIFIGEGVHSQYVYLVAKDGSNKLYTIKDKQITFSFESSDDKIIKVGEKFDVNINNPSNIKYAIEVETDDVIDLEQYEGKLSVTGIGVGSTRIIIKGTLMRSDGTAVEGSLISDEKTIFVLPIPVDSVILEKEMTIEYGEKLQLVAKIYPTNATDKKLKWVSSNPAIIAVDENGILTARKLGTVIITAVSNNSKIATCVVKSVPRSSDLFVNVINNKAVFNIFDITESEKIMLIEIMSKVNGNLELIQEYELTPDKTEIELELNPGVYIGEINIVNSRRLKIKTFSID